MEGGQRLLAFALCCVTGYNRVRRRKGPPVVGRYNRRSKRSCCGRSSDTWHGVRGCPFPEGEGEAILSRKRSGANWVYQAQWLGAQGASDLSMYRVVPGER